MKSASFDYVAPATIAEAIEILASRGEGAKLIAGGQTLMPLLAFRLAQPELLVDLRRIPDLDRIQITPSGLSLGAKVTWRDIEQDSRLRSAFPLLAAAIDEVAHYHIRNRGTVGGSLAHADPAAEMPGIVVACDAEIHVIGRAGLRIIPATEFFLGALDTSLARDEVIIEVRFPSWPPGRRWAFEEFALRRGDFAIAGVALYYDDARETGMVANAHIGIIGAGDRPHRLQSAEALLNGKYVSAESIRAVALEAARSVDPPSDLHASSDYRRALIETLVERALMRASAKGETQNGGHI